jgi:hypothetical protein
MPWEFRRKVSSMQFYSSRHPQPEPQYHLARSEDAHGTLTLEISGTPSVPLNAEEAVRLGKCLSLAANNGQRSVLPTGPYMLGITLRERVIALTFGHKHSFAKVARCEMSKATALKIADALALTAG